MKFVVHNVMKGVSRKAWEKITNNLVTFGFYIRSYWFLFEFSLQRDMIPLCHKEVHVVCTFSVNLPCRAPVSGQTRQISSQGAGANRTSATAHSRQATVPDVRHASQGLLQLVHSRSTPLWRSRQKVCDRSWFQMW